MSEEVKSQGKAILTLEPYPDGRVRLILWTKPSIFNPNPNKGQGFYMEHLE